MDRGKKMRFLSLKWKKETPQREEKCDEKWIILDIKYKEMTENVFNFKPTHEGKCSYSWPSFCFSNKKLRLLSSTKNNLNVRFGSPWTSSYVHKDAGGLLLSQKCKCDPTWLTQRANKRSNKHKRTGDLFGHFGRSQSHRCWRLGGTTKCKWTSASDSYLIWYAISSVAHTRKKWI